MQHGFRTALLAAGIGTMLAGGFAFAQQTTTPSTPPRMEMPGMGGHGGPMAGLGAAMGLRIAERMNALQTYLAITPQQQDAWNAFAQAAIAMVPDHGGPRELARLGAFDGIDRMTQHMQDLAQKAQKLDQAAQALKAVLTPDQIKKADDIWTARMEAREHRWQHWMHRWLHRGEGDGRDGHDGDGQ
jgi:periplasmic protein CpxP/Spy